MSPPRRASGLRSIRRLSPAGSAGARFDSGLLDSRLSQDGKSRIEDVVVDARIHRAGEAVGNVQELVAEADRVPLAGLDADSAAHVDQEIQSSCADDVNGDGLAGCDDAFVGLKERV